MNEIMKNLFAGLEEIPDEFYKWIKLDEERSNIIYYRRNGKVADYHCCQCGKHYQRYIVKPEVAIEDMMGNFGNVPQRHKLEMCKECGIKGRLEWLRCAVRREWSSERYFLWQTDKANNLVVRQFVRYTIREKGRSMERRLFEDFRVFMAPGMLREFEKYSYQTEWHKTKRKITKDYEMGGLSFGGNDNIRWVVANSKMRYFPIEEYVKMYNPDAGMQQLNSGVKVNVMRVCAKTPVVEMIHKIGMDALAQDIIRNDGKCRIIYKNGKTLEKVLRVKKEDIKWIVRQGDKIAGLRTCQLIRKSGHKSNDKTKKEIYNYVFHTGYPGRMENLVYILQYMSIEQVKNRIEKYKAEYNGRDNDTITEYADYLRMRKGLGYDMTNELYLKPRSLKETYTKLRVEDEAKKDENYINQMLEQYPKIGKRFKKLNEKYHYETNGLLIRPAKDAAEIVLEGRVLHHCVGNSNQRYMSNHNAGKNVILVIRKKSCEDVPYITVEIDKDFNVRQWYGANDRKPDKEQIEEFLSEYKAKKTEKKKAS